LGNENHKTKNNHSLEWLFLESSFGKYQAFYLKNWGCATATFIINKIQTVS